MSAVILAFLDPPAWVMPTVALAGPILVVVLTLFFHRGRSDHRGDVRTWDK